METKRGSAVPLGRVTMELAGLYVVSLSSSRVKRFLDESDRITLVGVNNCRVTCDFSTVGPDHRGPTRSLVAPVC